MGLCELRVLARCDRPAGGSEALLYPVGDIDPVQMFVFRGADGAAEQRQEAFLERVRNMPIENLLYLLGVPVNLFLICHDARYGSIACEHFS